MAFTIAIDGPAGAGKSTVARQVAQALGFTYLDTGAMYRAVAWKAAQAGVDPQDTNALADLAEHLHIAFSPLDEAGNQQVQVNGVDVTTAIRSPEISNLTSPVSAVPEVRRIIVAQQRKIGATAERGVVLEGRDIGTVVFPGAEVKIFLTASPEERARRRAAELTARGLAVSYAQVLAEQKERDERDSRRADSPLAAASDAVVLDTDSLTVPDVVSRILQICQERRKPAAEQACE